MIARLLQGLWLAALVAIAAAATGSYDRLGARFGPAAALVGPLALVALHPLAVALNFVVSRLCGDAVPRAYRLGIVAGCRMYVAEVVASARGVWFANPFESRRPAPTGDDTRPHAILFIHRYFCNRAVWHPFLREAAARGHRCEAITLPDPFAPIETHGALVRTAIAALAGGDRTVVVVAHSMGGLVARAAARAGESRIAHLVTLGTPHGGTWTARFGRGAALSQMRLGSAWLARLAADEDQGRGLPRARMSSLWSIHDDIVFPQSTARLAGTEDIAIGGCGHVALLYDRRVRRLVFERLDALQRTTAGAS